MVYIYINYTNSKKNIYILTIIVQLNHIIASLLINSAISYDVKPSNK